MVIHANPAKFFTPAHRKLAQERIAPIDCPILTVQGEETSRLNVINRETLIPELKAANKRLEIKSYPGEPHSFAFYSHRERTPRPTVAAQVFADVNAGLRRQLRNATDEHGSEVCQAGTVLGLAIACCPHRIEFATILVGETSTA